MLITITNNMPIQIPMYHLLLLSVELVIWPQESDEPVAE